jgi:hypothetical protein
MAMKSPLFSMPVEVLCAIVVLLDPISLIAASQTSRALRTFIEPTRHDFIQRLLALELLPESGGIVPLLRARDSAITPPMGSPEWRRNKYACSLCLKLRSHTWFDNHSILRLRLRKPPPGSPEATKLTTWEPFDVRDPATRWKRAQRRAAEEKERLVSERATYHRYCTGADFPTSTLVKYNPFRINWNFDFGPADKHAEDVEKALCGTERDKRACNHCRHQRGDWSHPGLALGRPDAPIVKSRQVPFPHLFERHFPGFLDFLYKLNPDPALSPPKTHARHFKNYNLNHRHDMWTQYTAYCGSCLQWQEVAGFGYYTYYMKEVPMVPLDRPKHQPPIPWPTSCNQCSQKEDPSAFTQRASGAAIQVANAALDAVTDRLTCGWNCLFRDFGNYSLGRFHRAGKRIMSGLPSNPPTLETPAPTLILDESIIPDLRIRLEQLRSFFRDEVPDRIRDEYVSNFFKVWLEDYELNEAVYLQMKKATAMIKEQPGIVELYFSEREPYRL